MLGAVALLLGGGAVALTFFPSARYSAQENRNLADLPQFEVAALTSGAYTAALDTYATERFPFRHTMRGARALYQLVNGRGEVGDTVLCTDGSLSRKITVNERIWRKNTAGLKRLQARLGERLTVAVAPCRIEARAVVLPPFFEGEDYAPYWEELAESTQNLITFQDFSDDALWYRTDHHWTTTGAYLAYCRLGEALEYTPFGVEAFTIEQAGTSFYGTTDAAAGIPFIKPDTIHLYRFVGDTEKAVKIDEKAPPFEGFYDFEKFQTRDGYGVFFGGNYARLSIESKVPQRRLLVLKDSFANALLPFLSLHFDVVAVDPRYATQNDLDEEFDATLLLCGMQTLASTEFLK